MQQYIKNNKNQRERRGRRVRVKIFGTKTRPRLSIFRSNKYMYAQLIDDEKGVTLLSASERMISGQKDATKTKRSEMLGKVLAESAKKKHINEVVFDRNGYKYHGRIKALAEGAREGGLKI